MGCIYSDFNEGKCQLFDPAFDGQGCDEKGICIVENDPCPYNNCENFEPIDPDEEYYGET